MSLFHVSYLAILPRVMSRALLRHSLICVSGYPTSKRIMKRAGKRKLKAFIGSRHEVHNIKRFGSV